MVGGGGGERVISLSNFTFSPLAKAEQEIGYLCTFFYKYHHQMIL